MEPYPDRDRLTVGRGSLPGLVKTSDRFGFRRLDGRSGSPDAYAVAIVRLSTVRSEASPRLRICQRHRKSTGHTNGVALIGPALLELTYPLALELVLHSAIVTEFTMGRLPDSL